MTEIDEIKNIFISEAKRLGDYKSISKTDLANGYCDGDESGDEIRKGAYWAALMLRYWFRIYEWASNSQSTHLQIVDYVDWLNDSLVDAFYYRSWRWEYQAVVKNGRFIEWKLDEQGNKVSNPHYYKIDPDAADKSINYFCGARRAKEYQALNKQKRKVHMTAISLDQQVDDNGDYILTNESLHDTNEDNYYIEYLVQKYIKQNRLIEALIVDGIACQDSFKETTKVYYTSHIDERGIEVKDKRYDCQSSFDIRKLVKHLSTINQEFMQDYFVIEYDIPLEVGNKIYDKLKTLNNAKLRNLIKKTLGNLISEGVADDLMNS